jgi:hypothetical protein
VAKLLLLAAGRRCVVELNRIYRYRAFYLKEEKRTANGYLVAGSEQPLLDGDTVHEGTR